MVLTNIPPDPILDLDPWVGQRSCTFKFFVTDAVTNDVLGEIHPIRGATLSHDTTRLIKRQVRLDLGITDTAAINPAADRISIQMVFPGNVTYPLGRYMFTNDNRQVFTSGDLGTFTLNDEMFRVDQVIRRGIDGGGNTVPSIVYRVLEEVPNIQAIIEASQFTSSSGWPTGSSRGQIIEALAVAGDFFSPWFDFSNLFRMIRTFNPANSVADFDFDSGFRVMRSGITKTNDLLTAPNTVLVTSNTNDSQIPITALARVPASAPNSVENRGFEIIQQETIQVASDQQAQAAAQGIMERLTIFETVTLTTPPDPRHDSYNVIYWQSSNWLELAWSMELVEGGEMNHTLRKAYKA